MASTQLITDMGTVISNGPSSVTTGNAIAQAGPIEDYPGMSQSIKLTLQEAKVKLTQQLALTDNSTDGPNYTLISNVLASLV